MRKSTKSWKSWASCSALVALLLAPTARADDLPDLPAPSGLTTVCAPEVEPHLRGGRLRVEVNQGVVEQALWLHPDVARCMTARLSLLPKYAARVVLLERRLQLGKDRLALEKRRADLAAEGEREAVGALEAAERGRRQAEEARDRWFRTPGFLVSMGAVGIIVVEVIAIFALRQVGAF